MRIYARANMMAACPPACADPTMWALMGARDAASTAEARRATVNAGDPRAPMFDAEAAGAMLAYARALLEANGPPNPRLLDEVCMHMSWLGGSIGDNDAENGGGGGGGGVSRRATSAGTSALERVAQGARDAMVRAGNIAGVRAPAPFRSGSYKLELLCAMVVTTRKFATLETGDIVPPSTLLSTVRLYEAGARCAHMASVSDMLPLLTEHGITNGSMFACSDLCMARANLCVAHDLAARGKWGNASSVYRAVLGSSQAAAERLARNTSCVLYQSALALSKESAAFTLGACANAHALTMDWGLAAEFAHAAATTIPSPHMSALHASFAKKALADRKSGAAGAGAGAGSATNRTVERALPAPMSVARMPASL
jgi:hypothetical protein